MLANIVIVVFGVVTAVHLIACAMPYPRLRQGTKMLLMPLLLAFYILTAQQISWLVVAALVFSFLGDTLLLFSGDTMFLLGASSFAVSHVFYSIHSLRSLTQGGVAPIVWFVVGIILVGIALLLFRMLRDTIPKAMRIPVIVYGAFLFMTCYATLLRCIANPGLLTGVAVLGSILFILSDVILATRKFGDQESEKKTLTKDFAVMATYITAQCLLVSSFML